MSRKLKNIGVVSLLTVASRVMGLVRDQLSAAIFGASELNSAFITAFSLPNLFRRLLGEGSLTAAFVPTLQEELQERGRPGAFDLLNQVVSWLFVVTGVMCVLAMLAFSQSRMLAGHEPRWYLAADLTAILFPYLVMICVAAALNATLNVFERFTEPALSPVWLNLAMILSLGAAGWNLAETDLGRMHWLCAGVLVGGFLQMIVPAGVLMREGWRPRWNFGFSARVKEIAMLMAPGLFGTAIYQINVYVSRLIAFSIDESAATLLFYANRLMELPIGVFAIAIGTVIYPLIARHAAEKNFRAMADDYGKGLRLVLILNVPAAVGLALLSDPIVRLIYQHGAFGANDAQAMAYLLMLFAIGLPFFSVASLTTRAFYAVKDTFTPVKVAALSFVINIGLSLLLKDTLGAPGLVVASTVAVVVQTILLQRMLVRRLPAMRFGSLWLTIGKVLVASIAMGAVVALGWWGIREMMNGARSADWVAILILIPFSVLAYGGVLWAVRVEGREELSVMMKKFVSRFGGAK
ncbi:MAG TPA: murein biosynthesis integral membrane protein MurJ [Opitutus sp.]|nr:murein biosynthesis integral membrane protein MurJ [Opitutus sp.]